MKLPKDDAGNVIVKLTFRGEPTRFRLARRHAIELAIDLLQTYACADCGEVHELREKVNAAVADFLCRSAPPSSGQVN